MEEMKIRFSLILSLLLILSLCSCVSNPEIETGIDAGEQDVHNEKKQNQKRLLFEDWKYKGFGKELPVWFEAAYKNNTAEIHRQVVELKNRKIKIITAFGINSDQADKSLKQQLKSFSSDYQLYDSCWALLGDNAAIKKNKGYPYFAAAVLYF